MTLFTKIIQGELPAYKIAEDERFFAFLDIAPLCEGHVLIVPKEATDKFYEVSDIYLQHWLLFARPIARAIEKAFPCNRAGMTIIGLEVPHAHMHLMPINEVGDMNFQKPKLKLSPETLKDVQKKIVDAL